MLHELSSPSLWQEFYAYKCSRGLLTKREQERLAAYIAEANYRNISEGLAQGTYVFSCPTRHSINKLGSTKKRVVYTFPEEENQVLKMLAYLLHRYDHVLCDNCYSFRKGTGARNAFMSLIRGDISDKWCFKADIRNYFNTIDVDILCTIVREVTADDRQLCDLLIMLLKNEWVYHEGKRIRENKGCMAGTPLSPFFANLYLKEMDRWFERQGVLYARYSDDIILFGAQDKIEEYQQVFYHFLDRYRLCVNEEKVALSAPGETWTFLGFSYAQGVIDISPVTRRKLLARIRRAARSLYRWRVKKGVSAEQTLRVMTRKFNRKFYRVDGGRELTWARWYFPMINTDASLKMIDQYLQQYLRYLVSGKHNHANFAKAPYAMLKNAGYRPLTTAYYDYKKRGLAALYDTEWVSSAPKAGQ